MIKINEIIKACSDSANWIKKFPQALLPLSEIRKIIGK